MEGQDHIADQGTGLAQLPPVGIRVGRQALTLAERVLDAAAPEEGCGLLLGRRESQGGGAGEIWCLMQVWPCCNVWEPPAERQRRFLVDPREQLHAGRWSRRRGLEMLGSLHSHPASEPLPSATDRALVAFPTLMMMRGQAPGGSPVPTWRCWWLDPEAAPLRLPWTMED
ncbi:MAG: M67 family metallopeptidase [Cyanobium sp.]